MPCHPIRPPWRAPPSVAWLHACGVCVSVPGQGRCQHWAHHSPRRETGGLETMAHRTLASSPGPPLAQSVVLETGPQPSPSTATFAPTPASLQRTAHHRSCQAGRTCANCGVGRLGLDPQPLQPPSPHPEQMSSPGCGPYLTPSSLPVLQPAHLSPASCTSLACVPLAPVLFACSPSVQLLLCVGVEALAPSSQLPSRYLLTLRRKVCKSQVQDGNSLLLSPTFSISPRETEAFLGPTAAYCIPHHLHMGWTGLECALSCLSPSKRVLVCIPLSPRGGWRGDGTALP